MSRAHFGVKRIVVPSNCAGYVVNALFADGTEGDCHEVQIDEGRAEVRIPRR